MRYVELLVHSVGNYLSSLTLADYSNLTSSFHVLYALGHRDVTNKKMYQVADKVKNLADWILSIMTCIQGVGLSFHAVSLLIDYIELYCGPFAMPIMGFLPTLIFISQIYFRSLIMTYTESIDQSLNALRRIELQNEQGQQIEGLQYVRPQQSISSITMLLLNSIYSIALGLITRNPRYLLAISLNVYSVYQQYQERWCHYVVDLTNSFNIPNRYYPSSRSLKFYEIGNIFLETDFRIQKQVKDDNCTVCQQSMKEEQSGCVPAIVCPNGHSLHIKCLDAGIKSNFKTLQNTIYSGAGQPGLGAIRISSIVTHYDEHRYRQLDSVEVQINICMDKNFTFSCPECRGFLLDSTRTFSVLATDASYDSDRYIPRNFTPVQTIYSQ